MKGQLLLRCGCTIAFRENEQIVCGVHGPQGVARVIGMPKPRIRGVASGPLVETCDLPAWTGRFAGSEPVKES